MRPARMHSALFLCLVLVVPMFSQRTRTITSGGNPQVPSSLQQCLAALTSGKAITDITLSGTVRRIVGPDDEIGSAEWKALASGDVRLDLLFPSGYESELHKQSDKEPIGYWTGANGTVHQMAQHNLWIDSTYIFPALLVQRLVSAQDLELQNVGVEKKNGRVVQHILSSRRIPNRTQSTAEHMTSVAQSVDTHLPQDGWKLLDRTSQLDIYLDSSTYFPAAVSFSIHPDNDANTDIPVEIDFSDYRVVNGVNVPLHVQKFINGSLTLDFQTQAATLNSGLSAASFEIQ